MSAPTLVQVSPSGPRLEPAGLTVSGAAANFGALLAARAVTGLAGLVTVGLLSRHLGPAGFGRLTLAIAISSLAATAAEAGLTTIGARELARADSAERRAELQAALGGLALSLTVLITGLGWAILLIATGANGASGVRGAVELLLILGLAAPVSLLGSVAATAAGRAYRIGIAQAVAALVSLSVVGALCLTRLGLIPAAGAVGLTTTLVGPLLLWLCPEARRRPGGPLGVWRMLWSEALSLGVVNLINVAYVKADALLLAVLASAAQLGVYGLAYNVVTLLIAVPSLLVASVQPLLVRAAARPDRFRAVLIEMTLLTELIAVALAVPLLRFSPALVHLLGGARYHSGGGVLRLLTIGLLATFPSGLIGAGLTALGRQRALLWPVSSALVVNVALNLLLIPRWHAVGAAAAFAITEVAVLAVTATVYRHLVPIRTEKIPAVLGAAGAVAVPCLVGPLVTGAGPAAAVGWTVLGWLALAGFLHLTGLGSRLIRGWGELTGA